jgi:hypothetical protein
MPSDWPRVRAVAANPHRRRHRPARKPSRRMLRPARARRPIATVRGDLRDVPAPSIARQFAYAVLVPADLHRRPRESAGNRPTRDNRTAATAFRPVRATHSRLRPMPQPNQPEPVETSRSPFVCDVYISILSLRGCKFQSKEAVCVGCWRKIG